MCTSNFPLNPNVQLQGMHLGLTTNLINPDPNLIQLEEKRTTIVFE